MSESQWQEIDRIKRGRFVVVYEFCVDPYDRPNDVYGIWKPVDKHEGGVTVQLPDAVHGEPKWWKSSNTTPAELAREYVKDPTRILAALAGEKQLSPSEAAYKSLQNELLHYVRGEMYTARARVFVGDEELHEDMVGFDHSTYLGNETVEASALVMCKEHFPVDSLVEDARKECRARAKALRATARKLDAAGRKPAKRKKAVKHG